LSVAWWIVPAKHALPAVRFAIGDLGACFGRRPTLLCVEGDVMGLIRIGLSGTLSGTVILALTLQSGCSLLFVKGPPANHTEMATFECSDSNAWPVVDAIWAVLNGIGAASASNDSMNPQQGQIVAVGLAWLALSGFSAIYGFSKVSECGNAKRLRDERYFGRGVAGPMPAPTNPDTEDCRQERRRALIEAMKVQDHDERVRKIHAAPVCD
jgi:hypothetical protein